MYRLYGMPEWTLFWTLFGRRSWNLARMDFSGNRVRMLPNLSRKTLFLCSPRALSIPHILLLHLLSIATFTSNQSPSFSRIQTDVYIHTSRIKKQTDLIHSCCASRNVHSFLTNCASGVWCHQRVWSECLGFFFFLVHTISKETSTLYASCIVYCHAQRPTLYAQQRCLGRILKHLNPVASDARNLQRRRADWKSWFDHLSPEDAQCVRQRPLH